MSVLNVGAAGPVGLRWPRIVGHNALVALATSLSVHPVSPTIGAEIRDIDLSVPLDPPVVAAVRDALNTHHVIFFRDQSLTPEQQADFARQFGVVTEAHPVLPAIEESTEVLAIDGKVDRASWWHTDVTFLQTPAMGSILYMLEAPEVGGDTMWASLQDAYDGLAPVVRTMCDGLIAIHHDPWFAADVDARGGYEWNGVWHEKLLPAFHPVVRTHPENRPQRPLRERPVHPGRSSACPRTRATPSSRCSTATACSPSTPAASAGRPGSVAFWDNRATMHYALDDYGDAPRFAHRVTLRGDRPFGPASPASPDG